MKLNIIMFLTLLLFSSLYGQSDQSPSKEWETIFDFGEKRDDVRDILVTSDMYIVGGMSRGYNDPTGRAQVQALNKYGELEWQWSHHNTNISTFTSSIIRSSKDAAYIFTSGSFGVHKHNKTNGKLVDSLYIADNSGTLIAENGEVIAAVTYGTYPTKAYILDYNLNTTETFEMRDIFVYGNIELTNNHLYLFGYDYDGKAFVMKFTLDGELEWDRYVDKCIKGFGDVGTYEGDGVYLAATQNGENDAFNRPTQWFLTIKYNQNGEKKWEQRWDGDPEEQTRLVNWTKPVLAHPLGGCVVSGSIAKEGNGPNENLTDYGVIAYHGNGDVRWTMREQLKDGWERNDIWASAWEEHKLILAGSGFKEWHEHPKRELELSRWKVPDLPVKVEDKSTPSKFILNQNYPNPFNPTTTIRYELPQETEVNIAVFNQLGEKIKTLVDKRQHSGFHQVKFNASNLSSGVYIYHMQTEGIVRSKKMIFLR